MNFREAIAEKAKHTDQIGKEKSIDGEFYEIKGVEIRPINLAQREEYQEYILNENLVGLYPSYLNWNFECLLILEQHGRPFDFVLS